MSEVPVPGERVYRHSIVARASHWLWALAMLVLVMSGLQIFNAAPYLDASDKSNPARRVLSFDATQPQSGTPVGTTTIFGHTFTTTHVFGYTDDGQGGEAARAFPGAVTLPAIQSLADGRDAHFPCPASDADRDLAAIRDEQPADHRPCRTSESVTGAASTRGGEHPRTPGERWFEDASREP